MAIYQCNCGFQATGMAEMRAHLKKTGHSTTKADFGYQSCIVHIPIQPLKRSKTGVGKKMAGLLDKYAKKAKGSKK
jgi:hypothetical protein